MREGKRPVEDVVDVDESVDKGVDCQGGGLEVPVEVNGGVVGDEWCTEVHVPGHSFSEEMEKYIFKAHRK